MLTKHKKQRKIKNFTRINRHKITSALIAKWFGYKNPVSFRNSKSYEDMLQGVEDLLAFLDSQNTQKPQKPQDS